MNRNKLKTYAPEARRDFIEAVTARAAQYGLTAKKIEPMTVEGDVAMIAGKPYSKVVGEKRKKLEARINRDGFEQTMEAMAYTWFNRLVAIRYMELHQYLDHGYRVLSHPQGHSLPEIVEHAEHVDLPGLDKQKVIELKLDGTKEEELYRMLLIGQCNALSKAMPFLFESIDDETELLLPDHLLHSDSLIRNLVNEIPEEDWQEVEIIGWLYQFYISEKKDEVIGKVVKSEDIPAATQLFTPNWIVKYLVQNSLGRQWMATYPDSPLKAQMEYYIEPAEQTPQVEAKLAEITPDALNPEELTLLDPACGSGHILVEAYDLLKAIYQERGYRAKDIPRLILEKNLYGLEIDDRAAQLAAFALMMKARADDRNIFERDVQPQVLAIQESKGLDAAEITEALNAPLPDGSTGDISQADVAYLIELFEEGKTFGALIQVPDALADKLPAIAQRVRDVLAKGAKMFDKVAARAAWKLIDQASIIASHYSAVVANPPYMVSKFMPPALKSFAATTYGHSKHDLYSAFINRGSVFAKPFGTNAMVAMHSWMFLSTFEDFRKWLLSSQSLVSMAHLGARAFPTISGEIVQVAAFVCMNVRAETYCPRIFRLVEGDSDDKRKGLMGHKSEYSQIRQDQFAEIPASPLLYWLPNPAIDAFRQATLIGEVAKPRKGFDTGSSTSPYFRCWYEIDERNIYRLGRALEDCRWVEVNKGGPFRRWYGNRENIVVFGNLGEELYSIKNANIRNKNDYFHPGITYTVVCSSDISFRLSFPESVFYQSGGTLRIDDERERFYLLALMNSRVAQFILSAICQTMNYTVNDVARFPLPKNEIAKMEVVSLAKEATEISKVDWDQEETSWEFRQHPLLAVGEKNHDLAASFKAWSLKQYSSIQRLRHVEEKCNEHFIEAYDLRNDLTAEVVEDDVSLYRPDEEEDIKRVISYVVGCMMGRYSLDEPGLIYAYSGNEGFDPSNYKTFPADEDGIVPLTEFNWFEDDAASRFEKFVTTVWAKDHLEENLEFVSESLGQKRGESPRDTIRRYLAADFFKHHLSLYKKRPIYWLFSSGKQRGFQALVYLHRYNEGTLARMRTEYVIPLLGKMTARIDHLADDIAAATSSQHRKRLEKEKDTVVKQLAEVQEFDEKLRHYADHRIKIDLDEGVKENYGKFGSLLLDVKKVTGKNPKD